MSVAVAYAAVFPKVVSLLLRGAVYRKPDYDLWAVSPILHIRQAACLFADVDWVEGGKAPFPEKARIWAHHIAIAVETRRLQNMSDVASEMAGVDFETKVAVKDLRIWAIEEGFQIPFLAYVAKREASSGSPTSVIPSSRAAAT